MGSSCDCIEVCESVWSFILNKLSHVINKHFVGLYRDGSLGVLRNYSGPTSDKNGKKLLKCLKTMVFQ